MPHTASVIPHRRHRLSAIEGRHAASLRRRSGYEGRLSRKGGHEAGSARLRDRPPRKRKPAGHQNWTTTIAIWKALPRGKSKNGESALDTEDGGFRDPALTTHLEAPNARDYPAHSLAPIHKRPHQPFATSVPLRSRPLVRATISIEPPQGARSSAPRGDSHLARRLGGASRQSRCVSHSRYVYPARPAS
jgi:hypothetical protein